MSSEASVTTWIGQLQAGDTAAAQHLWERYFRRLLVTLTARKALQLARHERRQKRGGAVLGEAGASGPGDVAVEQVLGRELTPAFAAQMVEQCERLLGRLSSAELRSIALWKMEGDTTLEIAAKLRRASRTAERKLRAIRSLWEKEPAP